jgi:hypothetical protein
MKSCRLGFEEAQAAIIWMLKALLNKNQVANAGETA